MDDRFCPFCFIRRTAPQVTKDLAMKFARVPGVHIAVLDDRCTGCGACVKKNYCLINAISIVDKKARVDQALCRGCARCTHFCQRHALEARGFAPDIINGATGLVTDTARRTNHLVRSVLK